MKPLTAPLRPIPRLIFFSRWLQLPLYLGLIIAQAAYVYLFVVEVWHLVSHLGEMDETKIMLAVLGLIDVVMISNLLIMVIIGGYDIFVSKLGIEGHEDEPEWLDHVNAGVLKVKLSMALISISSIHLLKTFIDAAQKDTHTILWQVAIHLAFLISALVMAWVDRLVSHAQPEGATAGAH
ncbi:TIGR00645 family protein [Ralstonia sp. UBA689]|uniref:TIGR00645 family protein n=1 Tax=Ralstonia sp. UBA689 TaxID=1947373 RepID=UPI0025FD921F|nr:TIGR00645 family protein [Ralstonia sp. UBA689]